MLAAPYSKNEESRLRTLRSYSLLDSLPEQELDDITELASFICDTPISLISLVDEDRQWFKSRVGLDAQETPRSESFCAQTLVDAQTLVVEDALADPRFAENPLVLGNPGIRFYAGAPLVAPNGDVLGSLCVIDTKARSLSTRQVNALESLSRQVMAVFESRLRLNEFQKASKALVQSEKLAAVGRLASSMAHEINNPLEAVTNLLYLARQSAVSSEVKQWLDEAELELRRVSVIANQTLRFHKQSTKPQAVTCTSLFSTTLNLYEARLKNARITVEKRKRANEPVACFEGDVRQVLSNVVTNAIDAMPHGGRLIVRSREATDWPTGRRGVALTIADTGHGMDHDTQCRMFEAFSLQKALAAMVSVYGSAPISCIGIRGRSRFGVHNPGRFNGTAVILFLPFEMVEGSEAKQMIGD